MTQHFRLPKDNSNTSNRNLSQVSLSDELHHLGRIDVSEERDSNKVTVNLSLV